MKTAKSRHFIALLVAASSGNAFAADLGGPKRSMKDTPAVVESAFGAPVYNWSGLYGGVLLGGVSQGWMVDFNRNNNHGPADIGSTGITYGAMLGYNVMVSPNFVLGVEADIGASNASQSNAIFDNDTSYSTIGTFGSVRGRAGYAVDRLLIYGTAGFAFGQITNEIQKGRNAGEEIVHSKKWENGYVVGGGLEYAFAGNLLGRVEYLYSNYGTVSLRNREGNVADMTNDMHQVRVGLAYKF